MILAGGTSTATCNFRWQSFPVKWWLCFFLLFFCLCFWSCLMSRFVSSIDKVYSFLSLFRFQSFLLSLVINTIRVTQLSHTFAARHLLQSTFFGHSINNSNFSSFQKQWANCICFSHSFAYIKIGNSPHNTAHNCVQL